MATKDPKIDAYIAKAATFAKPILKHLRKVVHAGCPQVEETMKWSMPHFDYKGMLRGMAAFSRSIAPSVFGKNRSSSVGTGRGKSGDGKLQKVDRSDC